MVYCKKSPIQHKREINTWGWYGRQWLWLSESFQSDFRFSREITKYGKCDGSKLNSEAKIDLVVLFLISLSTWIVSFFFLLMT